MGRVITNLWDLWKFLTFDTGKLIFYRNSLYPSKSRGRSAVIWSQI